MVAYSFKPRFIAPIVAGAKRQTIRADRKRHARRNETLQLYTGMRTKACRLIGRATCEHVGPIRIDLDHRRVEINDINVTRGDARRDRFAQSDGFADWAALDAFFRAAHPNALIFSGWIIFWRDFEPAP